MNTSKIVLPPEALDPLTGQRQVSDEFLEHKAQRHEEIAREHLKKAAAIRSRKKGIN